MHHNNNTESILSKIIKRVFLYFCFDHENYVFEVFYLTVVKKKNGKKNVEKNSCSEKRTCQDWLEKGPMNTLYVKNL